MKPEAKPRCAAGALALLLLLAPAALAADDVQLTCTPRTFQVVPGEPVRLELTIAAESAAGVRLYVPADPLLHLRAVEKRPVERTPAGQIIHRRVVLWQGLAPGEVTVKDLAVETQGRKLAFPEITITIRDPSP